jgi:transcriptional regulator with XRE-family HTH domain
MPAKSPKDFRPDFGNLLRSLLAERGLGVREFARMVDDFDPGFLAGVLSGKRPPPLAQFPTWAEALNLKDKDRQEFLELGHLTHCQEYVWELVKSLRTENERLRKRLG